MSDPFWRTEQQFARLEFFLPTDIRSVPQVDDRRVISGIVHALKPGCRWKDTPVDYGPHKALYNRFVRWRKKGVRQAAFDALTAGCRPASPRSCSTARTSRRIARPLTFLLTGGNAADAPQAPVR